MKLGRAAIFVGILMLMSCGSEPTVVLTGECQNAKMGALITTKSEDVFIHGKKEWADDMLGKTIEITGTVSRIDDMPVYLVVPGAPAQAGIPCKTESELEKMKWRTVITMTSHKLKNPSVTK